MRRIPSSPESPSLFLSFDDGPGPEMTPAVLDVLAEHDCKATFFLVAKRAERARDVVGRMIEAGHAIGNHSLDHTWTVFFRGPRAMLEWIAESERRLQDLYGRETVGFRSPAGVRTPVLHWALRELDIPLVHWNLRSFDRAHAWTEKRAMRALDAAQPGSIVLLHDTHRAPHVEEFLRSLRTFLCEAKRRGFRFAPLHRRVVRAALREA